MIDKRDTQSELPGELTNALSADIRFLGNMLGTIIREQHGDEAFDLVERIRASAKARRKSENEQDRVMTVDLLSTVDHLDLDSKRVLIKAFSNYFQLINLAEDQQRTRVLRQREATGVLSESIQAAIRDLHQAGLSFEQVRALLEKICIRLVLTAHPSEAKRKEVLVKLRQIALVLSQRDRQ